MKKGQKKGKGKDKAKGAASSQESRKGQKKGKGKDKAKGAASSQESRKRQSKWQNYQPKPNSGAKPQKKPPKPKLRNNLGKGPKTRAVNEQSRGRASQKTLFKMPELMSKDEILFKVLHCANLYVGAEGIPTIKRLEVFPGLHNPNQYSIKLGANTEQEKGHASWVSLDRVFTPKVKKSEIDGKHYMYSCSLKHIVPENEELDDFYVLSAPNKKVKDLDEGQILLRVMVRHPRTPRLINGIEELHRKKILFKGEIWDKESNSFVPDLLIVLDDQESLKFETKDGWFVLRNHGHGQASVERFIEKGRIKADDDDGKAKGNAFAAALADFKPVEKAPKEKFVPSPSVPEDRRPRPDKKSEEKDLDQEWLEFLQENVH